MVRRCADTEEISGINSADGTAHGLISMVTGKGR